jgi:hypothetical protein
VRRSSTQPRQYNIVLKQANTHGNVAIPCIYNRVQNDEWTPDELTKKITEDGLMDVGGLRCRWFRG